MNKKEFYQKIDDYGIDLDQYQIAIGYKTDEMYYRGVYNQDGTWYVYRVGDRNRFSSHVCTNEDDAFDSIYHSLLVDIRRAGLVNKSITEDVIQTPKLVVCDFLQKRFSMSNRVAENTWNDLKTQFDILNEVKYFALNDYFVPDKDCCHIQGYSAQDIYNKTYLTEIGAFGFLIYMRRHPEQAKKYLKDGMPIRIKDAMGYLAKDIGRDDEK